MPNRGWMTPRMASSSPSPAEIEATTAARGVKDAMKRLLTSVSSVTVIPTAVKSATRRSSNTQKIATSRIPDTIPMSTWRAVGRTSPRRSRVPFMSLRIQSPTKKNEPMMVQIREYVSSFTEDPGSSVPIPSSACKSVLRSGALPVTSNGTRGITIMARTQTRPMVWMCESGSKGSTRASRPRNQRENPTRLMSPAPRETSSAMQTVATGRDSRDRSRESGSGENGATGTSVSMRVTENRQNKIPSSQRVALYLTHRCLSPTYASRARITIGATIPPADRNSPRSPVTTFPSERHNRAPKKAIRGATITTSRYLPCRI